MKISGKLDIQGVMTCDVSAKITKIRKISELECSCYVEISEPIEKSIQVYGVDELNAFSNAVMFIANLAGLFPEVE